MRENTKSKSLLILFLAAATAGCSTLNRSGTAVFKDSTLSNLNPAPASMAPPELGNEDNPLIDPVYMRSQADYHFTMAEALSLEGKSQKAIEEFKLTLVYDPDSIRVRLRLSAEYVRLGLLSEAVEQAEAAVEKDPNSLDARLLLGGLYSSMKMFDMALKHYRELIKKHPENTEAPIYVGAILAEQKKYDEAISYFLEMANKKDNKTAHQAWYYVGRIRQEQGSEKHLRLAEKAYSNSLGLKPDYVEAVLALSDLYRSTTREAKSVKLLESYNDKFGPNRHISRELSDYYLQKEDFDKAYAHLEVLEGFERDNLNIKMKMALILIERKDYDKAVVRLEEILLQAPESDRIRFYLAAVYEEIKESATAIKHYSYIPPSSTYYPEAVIHTAHLYKSSGNYEKAIETVTSAINHRDDLPQFYAFYASLLDDRKEYNKAVSMLTGAVEKFPTHAQLRFFLGSMHDRVGNTDSTIEQMQKVLEIDGNHVQAMNYLAYTYAELNQNLETAEELARKALSFQPNDGYILDTVGWILFKKGNVEGAIRYLEAAYKAKSTEAIIAEHLGDAYFRYQLIDKAKKMYMRAVENETDADKLQKIRAKIAAIDEQKENRTETRRPASSSNKSQSDTKQSASRKDR